MSKICNVIKDLLPSYVEDLLSNDSKDFVNNHIEKCTDCQKILESIKNNETEIQIKSEQEQKIELNHLKNIIKK